MRQNESNKRTKKKDKKVKKQKNTQRQKVYPRKQKTNGQAKMWDIK